MINIDLEFGQLAVYDTYIIGTMNRGVDIDMDIAKKIIETAKEHFNDNKWAYISNRIHPYSLDPTLHAQVPEFEKNMVALAVVVYNDFSKHSFNLEQTISPDGRKLKMFSSIGDAKEWIKSVLAR